MLGLVSYTSSDEDEPALSPTHAPADAAEADTKLITDQLQASDGASTTRATITATAHGSVAESRQEVPEPSSQKPLDSDVSGEQRHHETAPASRSAAGEQSLDQGTRQQAEESYIATRAALHAFTLPPVPNLALPVSPPGSPLRSTVKKIEQFLDLKTQGVHFNEKLASSSALRNPAMLANLMRFAGIDDQYASSLPKGTGGIPANGWPVWSYSEALDASQRRVLLRKEKETRGQPRAFVPASAEDGPSPKRRKG